MKKRSKSSRLLVTLVLLGGTACLLPTGCSSKPEAPSPSAQVRKKDGTARPGTAAAGHDNETEHTERAPGDEPSAKGSSGGLPFRISAETTYWVEPLLPSGQVDYRDGLNRRAGQQVRPEDNAAVELLKALGTGAIDSDQAATLARYWNVTLPPPSQQDFVGLSQFIRDRYPDLTPEDIERFYDQLLEARTAPWSAQQFPVLSEWLDVHRQPLDRAVEAASRREYYVPMCGDGVYTAEHPLADAVREVVRALTARAMRTPSESISGSAEPPSPWVDLTACLQLARHHTRSTWTPLVTTGNAIASTACETIRALASYRLPSEDPLQQVLARLAECQGPVVRRDVLEFERIAALEFATRLATGNRAGGDGASSAPSGPASEVAQLVDLSAVHDPQFPVDWDFVLVSLAAHYEAFLSIADLGSTAEQWTMLQQQRGELARLLWGEPAPPLELFDDLSAAVQQVLAGEDARQRAVRLAALLAQIHSGWYSLLESSARAADDVSVTRLCLGILAARRAKGSDPDDSTNAGKAVHVKTLQELVPSILPELPRSQWTGKAFHYGETGENFAVFCRTEPSGSLPPVRILSLGYDYHVAADAAARLRSQGWEVHAHEARSNQGRVTDQHLQWIASIPALEYVAVFGAEEVSASGWQELGHLPSLQYLLAYGAEGLTAEVLGQWAESRMLRGLNLSHAQVGDEQLEQLSAIAELQALELDGTDVTDEGLRHLGRLSDLRSLNLSRTPITDLGLTHLARIHTLESLDISHTQVSDSGLAELARLEQLRILRIGHTRVTDDGLPSLFPLRHLRTLGLEGLNLSELALDFAAEIMPDCDLVR